MASFPLKKWWALQIVSLDPRVGKGPTQLFCRLLEYHNSKTGLCFPGQARLSDDLAVSVRTIRTWTKCLCRCGYVELIPKGGRQGTYAYKLWQPTGRLEFKEAEKSLRGRRKRASAKP